MNNANWWANKLGTPQVPQQRQDIPMPPSQQPMTRYAPPQPQQPQTKAQSATQTSLCPNCSSGNYMQVGSGAARCYDCGYPLEQSGSKYGSLTGAKVEGPVKGSLGNSTQNNWNPQGIIGTISE